MSSQLATNMRKTSDAFLTAFESWTTEAVLAVRAVGCEHSMLPASLQVPKRSNDEFREYFSRVEGALSNVKMEMHDYFASVEDRRAVFHTTLTADATDGRPYDNEYMFVLSFDEAGEKITKITEMLDSLKTREIQTRLRDIGVVQNH